MIPRIKFRHTDKEIQVLVFNTNNLFIYSQLNGFKYCDVLQILQLNISYLFTQLNEKSVLLQTIQLSKSQLFALRLNVKQFSLTHSYATTPGQSELRSEGNVELLCITGASPSDCFMSYPEYLFMGGLTPLQRCSWYILQPKPTVFGLNSTFSVLEER